MDSFFHNYALYGGKPHRHTETKQYGLGRLRLSLTSPTDHATHSNPSLGGRGADRYITINSMCLQITIKNVQPIHAKCPYNCVTVYILQEKKTHNYSSTGGIKIFYAREKQIQV